jgi:hypothetical protein
MLRSQPIFGFTVNTMHHDTILTGLHSFGRHRNSAAPSEDRMIGITSYGAYVPYLRMPLSAAAGGGKSDGPSPEKAVAYWTRTP